CLIWHLSYADGLEGLEGGNNISDLYGCYDLSDDYVRVVRNEAVMVEGGTLSEDPFTFCVGDGEADHVSKVSVEGASGPNSQWVVTDEEGTILGLPPTPEAVNFDGAGPGICLIWHLSYADGLEGLEGGNNIGDLSGTYDFSDDNVRVYRNQPEGGEVTGGPYEFTVGDGEADNVSSVMVSGNSGANSQWVVTDEEGTILGLPPSPEAVNFDGAGPGVCLIWHLSYADGLEGLEVENNVSDLYGCYDFSDEYVRVERIDAAAGKSSVTVFPLPAKDVINLSMDVPAGKKIGVRLFDLAGNDITSSTERVNEKTINVQRVPSGLYFMTINDGSGKRVTKKVIIQ
ncbi:MAG: T9SS type A sorting domain-containing protein, partial [Flavobacteriaceae bacterium]